MLRGQPSLRGLAKDGKRGGRWWGESKPAVPPTLRGSSQRGTESSSHCNRLGRAGHAVGARRCSRDSIGSNGVTQNAVGQAESSCGDVALCDGLFRSRGSVLRVWP